MLPLFISGRGRDTHATMMSGNSRAGNPPSSTSNCQELGVGNLTPALDTASGRTPQVGDLACSVSTAPGRVVREETLGEWQRAARAVERMQRSGSMSPILVKMDKCARPLTSEEEELRVDLVGLNKQGPVKTPVTGMETDRLLERMRNCILKAENGRRRYYKNIEDEASEEMKHCYNKILEMIEILRERLPIEAGDSISKKEAIELRNRLANLKEKNTCLEKERRKLLLNSLAARNQTTTRDTAAPDLCRESSALVSTSDRHTSTQKQLQQQQQWEQTTNTATTEADGPHESPTLSAESTQPPDETLTQPLQEQAAPSRRRRRSGAQRRKKKREREREIAAISLSCTKETTY
ncbi:uncharacterized protein LOC124954639 isoform X2 [Vespa velutina]|uniref:uncharacterized protein LOC124954639 isoform X2 n=1 Tax=Vespa velutina TaxID=202808 RepID=UPI001FB48D3E|nr:uncharacterized protein LOC124954639 isoform X2 [Vespa velutina]